MELGEEKYMIRLTGGAVNIVSQSLITKRCRLGGRFEAPVHRRLLDAIKKEKGWEGKKNDKDIARTEETCHGKRTAAGMGEPSPWEKRIGRKSQDARSAIWIGGVLSLERKVTFGKTQRIREGGH